MKYGQVEGVTKPVSRIGLGSVMFGPDRSSLSGALLDFFFEQGGNCIDTAWVYRKGAAERSVGAWIENRGVRGEIVLIGKGAATALHPRNGYYAIVGIVGAPANRLRRRLSDPPR
jgi:aryl-alcohol dehydrogenase-like predicted oxidoreductase